ncbi:MAG: hypothetical protein JST00_09010 [Deltaproteobacteria bacterium]|nr:hypothetical protein [Deltaproteobacteria bacterium]
MSEEKPKPIDDLKQGLGLLFRAAKGAVEKIPTEKIEDAVKDGAKEVTKAVEAVASEVDKVIVRATTGSQKPDAASSESATSAQAKKQQDEDEARRAAQQPEQPYDDAYAPEPPPKGPRVG